MVVRHEFWVGENLKGGQIAEAAISKLLDPTDDALHMLFGHSAALDIGERAAGVDMRGSGGFLQFVKDLTARRQARYGDTWQLLGIRLPRLLGKSNKLDCLLDKERHPSIRGRRCAGDRLVGDLESPLSDLEEMAKRSQTDLDKPTCRAGAALQGKRN